MLSFIKSISIRAYLVFILSMGMLHSPTMAENDWTQFGGPNRNFCLVTSDDGIASKRTVGESWRVAFQGGDASPLVVGDRVVCAAIDFTTKAATLIDIRATP